MARPSDARLGLRQLSTSHDPDDERFACCLDHFLGDDREMVNVQDALDLGDQAASQAEVPTGDAGDRGDCLAGGEVGCVAEPQFGPVPGQYECLLLCG